MDAPFVALDLGNHRLKAGWFTGSGPPERTLSLDYDEVPARWSEWIAAGGGVASAALSSVCGAERLASMLTVLEAGLCVPVTTHPDPGLRLDVRSPETVGLDRLYAARGALARGFDGAIVVDVGTALTVDAVAREVEGEPSPGAEVAGVFLGGAIAPGPELVARALATAAQLHEVRPRPDVPALGKDTREALEAGVAHTVAGAAQRLVRRVRAESGLHAAALVLTGGARAFVAAALAEEEGPLIDAPHLVLEGLAACAGRVPGERG